MVAFEILRLFKDIAQQRSVSKGAKLNQISQSAASQHLRELEHRLGTTLLDRGTRPLAITEAGHLYLDMCRDVLRSEEEFQAELDRLKTKVEGAVRVASIYSVGLSEMSQLEHEFLRRYPDARLEIEYLRPERVYEAVSSGRADLGLMSYPQATREVAVIPWREEEMVVAVSPYHRLAGKNEVNARELEGAQFIGFDEDLPIQKDINRFLREHGVTVHPVLHFDNLQMIKEAVAHGSGISIMPARVMQAELAQGRLSLVPIAGLGLYRPVGIVHQRRKQFHRAGRAFLDLLQELPLPKRAK